MNIQSKPVFSRRSVIKLLAGTGALIVADGAGAALLAKGEDAKNLNFKGEIGPYIRINPDNTIIVGAPSPEIGSGMHTTTTMLIAEELGADFDQLTVRQLPVKSRRRSDGRYRWAYGPQGGGGSFTTRRSWLPVREIAAVTRQVLLEAASEHLSVDVSELTAANSHIEVRNTNRRIPFAEIAADAARKSFPDPETWIDTPLKPADDFTIIGSERQNKAAREVIDGSAIFGMDAEMDGMLYATIVHAPTYTATIGAIDDMATRAVRGVVDIVRLDAPTGIAYQKHAVAVVAESYWAAQQGLDALNVTWNQPPIGDEDSTAGMYSKLHDLLQNDGQTVLRDGQGKDALEDAAVILDAEYALPSLAHATMEPMNCIVYAQGDKVHVVEPGHNSFTTIRVLTEASGLTQTDIDFELTRTGGSFGRRLWSDYALECYWISKAVGRPVKLMWSRESDMSVDGFRLLSRQRLRAGVDHHGKIISWHHTTAHASSINGDRPPPEERYSETIWTGNFPRGIVPNFELDFHSIDWNIMQGAWRAPMPSQQGFFIESFMNELAHASKQDPLDFRLKHLEGVEELPYPHWGGPTWSPQKLADCLKVAAEQAGWRQNLDKGFAHGIAGYFTFGSYCALVVEAAIRDGKPWVRKVTAAIDCGLCINPNGARAQIEGGINDALSATLAQSAVVEQGRAVRTNFDTYEMMRIDMAPPIIDVHILHSRDDVFGTGEISVPPLAPALTDALFQLTGKRIRELPIGNQLST